jgi:hypothetical protein
MTSINTPDMLAMLMSKSMMINLGECEIQDGKIIIKKEYSMPLNQLTDVYLGLQMVDCGTFDRSSSPLFLSLKFNAPLTDIANQTMVHLMFITPESRTLFIEKLMEDIKMRKQAQEEKRLK